MGMERTENERKIVDKANFYFSEKVPAHVLIIPKGKFKNGLFVSDIQENKSGSYFWFIESDSTIPIRLFLFEIYDIEDYQEMGDEKNVKN